MSMTLIYVQISQISDAIPLCPFEEQHFYWEISHLEKNVPDSHLNMSVVKMGVEAVDHTHRTWQLVRIQVGVVQDN